MHSNKKLLVSHAPFWHDGSSLSARYYNIMLMALIPVIAGILTYGTRALGVVALSVSTAIIWEYLMNRVARQPVSIGDGNAALIGLLLAMMFPATMPWWAVIVGTFVAVIIAKGIFGGLGANPFNPVVISVTILMVSWPDFLDFNYMLADYQTGFDMAYPLVSAKYFGTGQIEAFSTMDLLLGRQSGGIGATFGLGIIIGGIYLMARGYIRWEIVVSFLVGVFITALLFNKIGDSTQYAGPMVHLLTGYTLIGAVFLATEDSSSPVNFVPMLIYGACGGLLTVLIRNIGVYVDGVVFAVLIINLVNPLVDKIRPKAMGRVV
ncbi:MAG: RnfABCDGE type electron transport complex subunit D [Thermodesulfobacteriota bacterium]|nr:RnfABCDGE type electron transport complex subunit D [Thermodesulfobacteriota bacterium]